MAIENDLLVKCLDIARHIVNNDLMTTMSIKVGKEFSFDFNNSNHIQKRLSPSQKRRNFDRQEHLNGAENKNNKEYVYFKKHARSKILKCKLMLRKNILKPKQLRQKLSLLTLGC